MTLKATLSSISRVLVISAVVTVANIASATALFTLKGETPEAKLSSEGTVRLSILGWTEAANAAAIVEEYKKYQTSKNGEEFFNFLQTQETKGYLFTKEAAGYAVKYAWQSNDGSGKHMVLLVVPALKTHNPYMWKQRNDSADPFSLLEIDGTAAESLMRTSLSAAVAVNNQGQLELTDHENTPIFARLQDDTPYYLKQKQ